MAKIPPSGKRSPTKVPADLDSAARAETIAEKYPPLKAFGNADAAAVAGHGNKSDGVQGTTGAAGKSAVSGIHSGGGTGVYGKSSGNAGSFDGNVQVNGNVNVSGDIFLTGADLAEQFDCATAAPIEPGTLVIIDGDGALHESHDAYDRKVIGVVAGAGAFRPGVILDTLATGSPRVAVSLMGKAYCKVDADRAPVQVGDLLTSSPTRGHAMKASDPQQAFGTVVGKALGALPSGQGLIPILIALQ